MDTKVKIKEILRLVNIVMCIPSMGNTTSCRQKLMLQPTNVLVNASAQLRELDCPFLFLIGDGRRLDVRELFRDYYNPAFLSADYETIPTALLNKWPYALSRFQHFNSISLHHMAVLLRKDFGAAGHLIRRHVPPLIL